MRWIFSSILSWKITLLVKNISTEQELHNMLGYCCPPISKSEACRRKSPTSYLPSICASFRVETVEGGTNLGLSHIMRFLLSDCDKEDLGERRNVKDSNRTHELLNGKNNGMFRLKLLGPLILRNKPFKFGLKSCD